MRLQFRRAIPFIYRLVALLVACIQMLAFMRADFFQASPLVYFVGAACQTLLVAFAVLFVPRPGPTFWSLLLGTDLVMSALIVTMTGGSHSPFDLYALSPLLTASVFMDRKSTFAIAVPTVLLMVSQLANPLYPTSLNYIEARHLVFYGVTACLMAVLPYLVNFNLRRQIEAENTLRERLRLSREIHDGVAQTLHALCWQVQQVRRDPATAGNPEIASLETLAEEARRGIKESLALLRSEMDGAGLVADIKDSLQKLKEDYNIDSSLDVDAGGLELDGLAEAELMHICREALANIAKHSNARRVQVKVKRVNHHVELSITDNGRGFDALAYYRGGATAKGHHGLAVMQERAQSINGRLRVWSMPSRGTEVRMEIPCNGRKWAYR